MQSAIKTSHEKEKIHTNSAKYWSIVGSLAGNLIMIFSMYRLHTILLSIQIPPVIVHFFVFFVGALLGICGTAFSFYNRNDLLSDINKEFLVIRSDTKSINEQVQLLLAEQRDFLRTQQQSDRTNSRNDESWMHWVARQTYVISVYRYFVAKTVS